MLAAVTRFRRRVGAFIGVFEAGFANRRLKEFVPSRAHLNTLTAAAGPDITVPARFLLRNNGYACQRASESPQFGARKIPHLGGGGDQPLV